MSFSERLLAASCAAGAAAAAVFLAWPEIDPAAVRWFYAGDGEFPFARVPGVQEISALLRAAALAAGAALICAILRSAFPRAPAWLPERRVAAYLLATLVVAPGLLVNTVLKDNWGRARPQHTAEFGGDKAFSPPLLISDQCGRNCSFVSGDAAMGFVLVALALAYPARRRLWLSSALAAGAVIGAERVAQGAHYPSDVVFSGVFVTAAAALLYRIAVERRAPP